jgi:hypothetical protein
LSPNFEVRAPYAFCLHPNWYIPQWRLSDANCHLPVGQYSYRTGTGVKKKILCILQVLSAPLYGHETVATCNDCMLHYFPLTRFEGQTQTCRAFPIECHVTNPGRYGFDVHLYNVHKSRQTRPFSMSTGTAANERPMNDQ